MSHFAIRMPKNTFYGRGSLTALGAEAKRIGTKALLVSDEVMSKLGYIAKAQALLDDAGVAQVAYLGIASEPTNQYVLDALALYQKEDCDLLVALGGGSCIDTAKAVGVLATNGGAVVDYMGNKKLATQPAAPLIAIPTTAGTGSEATDVTVITDEKNDIKMMIKQPVLLPETAIVDAELSATSPKSITAATGIDALCHAIEAYISKKAQPFTDDLALFACKEIIENLLPSYYDGNNIAAREQMAFAAMRAGIAFSNSSVTLVHGMSRPIGALFHVPHGVSNAMLLPAVLEFSMDACSPRLATIARYVFDDLANATDGEAAASLVARIKKLCLDLEIPNMKGWGVDGDKLKANAQKMAADALASGSPGLNPRVPSQDEIVALYDTCFDYQFSAS